MVCACYEQLPAERRCDGCHLLAAVLAELGLRCVALHSHKSQKRRLAALHTFRAGELIDPFTSRNMSFGSHTYHMAASVKPS